MFVSRPAASLIRGRLDAEAYNPEFLGAAEALAASGLPVESVDDVSERIRCGPFGSSLHASRYVEDGVPFIAPVAFSSGHIEIDAVERISKADHARLQGTSFRPPSIVFARVGHPHVAAVPESFGEFNIHGDVIGAKLNEGNDAHFMYGYFTCAHGGRLLRQAQAGTTRPRINTPDLSVIPVVRPRSAVQRYIGSKVRQAEALREWAQTLSAEVADTFRTLHRYSPDRRLGSWRQSARGTSDERLDAAFYAPPAVQLVGALRAGAAREVSDLAPPVKDSGFDPAKPISYFEIGGLDVATGCAWPTVVPAGEAPSRAQRAVRHWDILVGTVRPERKNVGIVPPTASGQLVATSGVSVLRAGSAEHAAYLWGFLRSDAATEQLMRWNTGAAYPAIDDDVPARVLMPALSDDEMTRLGARWMRIPMLHAAAKALIASARLLVEALIERKVTEAELIEAGKDTDADRALLSRLAEDGFDGAGTPLFSDLDGVADLIAEAATQR